MNKIVAMVPRLLAIFAATALIWACADMEQWNDELGVSMLAVASSTQLSNTADYYPNAGMLVNDADNDTHGVGSAEAARGRYVKNNLDAPLAMGLAPSGGS